MKNFIEITTMTQDKDGQIIQDDIGQKLWVSLASIAAIFIHRQHGQTTIQLMNGMGYICKEPLEEVKKKVNIAQQENEE